MADFGLQGVPPDAPGLVEVGVAHLQPAFEDMATLRRFRHEVLPALS
jgi:hypothetical protein